MKTMWIMPTILLITGVSTEMKDSRHLDDVIKEILLAEDIREVQFVIQDFLQQQETIFNEVYKTVSQIWPTNFISFEDSIPTEFSSSFRTYSHTLILYVYIAKSPPNALRAYRITDVVRFLLRTCCPKILFLTSLEGTNNDFQTFLKLMWTKRILDLTVLEVTKGHDKVTQMALHQYNPFRKTYTKQTYFEGIEWFPNKLTNLYGYPITVDMIQRIGHNQLKRDSQGCMIEYTGPDGRALSTLIHKLNFTVALHPRNVENIDIVKMDELESGKDEMLMTTVPYDFKKEFDRLGYTYPFSFEKWCALVPIFYERNISSLHRLKKSIFGIIVMVAFGALTRYMRFDRKVWSALKIFGVMISIPMARAPRRSAERFALLFLVLVSAMYSSDFYANLTTTRLLWETEINYKSFLDLEKSGLRPVLKQRIYNMTLKYGDEEGFTVRKKAILVPDMEPCAGYLLKHKNVSCVMETNMATVMIYTNLRNGMPKMKICRDVCYWKPPVGYLFHRYSPYINLISDIMSRMVEAGIRHRWYLDYFSDIARMKTHSVIFDRGNDTTISMFFNSQFFYIIQCGYMCAIAIFLGEIIKFRMTRRRG